jgi:RNA polymerase sigma-70 factor (ECF subfamily)
LESENATDFADSYPDAEERILRGERFQRLRAVVMALGDQERQCLFLRAEGLRYREIAEALGVSVATVSSLLARSLEKLKRADGARG